MNNIIKITIIFITTIIIYNNNLCAKKENVPQNSSSESKEKYSWQEFEEERKKINSIIDITDLQKELDETSKKLRQIKDKTHIIQLTEEEILRLKIRKEFLETSLDYAQHRSEDYSHNLSAMMHGLDAKALYYNCYNLKEYNYEQCSRIRDQEYYAVKTMILASSQKKNFILNPLSQTEAQERYDDAKTKINNKYKQKDNEYLASLSPEEAERTKKADFTIDGYHCQFGNYNNHDTYFYNPQFMIEYSKESSHENDTLATMHGLNQKLYEKHQNPEFKEQKDSWHLFDHYSIIGLKTNAIINMQHISNLRLIKEWEIAKIQCDKTKKEINSATENLMEIPEGKQYQNAFQQYIIQKNNLIEELKKYSKSGCSFVTKSNREICDSIKETRLALEAKALPRAPLMLKGIDSTVQNEFNNARENYYQATEILKATEQYHNNFAPTEKAYYYWQYKERGLRIIATKNSCPVKIKYIRTPTIMGEHRYYPPSHIIEKMKNALIKKMYPYTKQCELYTEETEYTCPPVCYKIREQVVTELLAIIEEMRIDAGLKGKEENIFFKFNVDRKSTFEHCKKL